ncbi:MAG: hypothetical protein NTV24_04200 [Candidatus Woesebacteria bacterium]|nr:hypothetical protein [Candidatus Woesebacteria bacterium]
MAYYHDIITQKSWEELKTLNRKIKFVLIGGWAIYLYTRQLKSKDIDILISYDELGRLRNNYEVIKNDRLKKYEARKEEIQIDIYLPHYSEIGIPVDILINNSISLEGFKILKKEFLICLKIYVFSIRGRTPKGEKDFLDILSLFKVGVGDIDKIIEIKKDYNLEKQFTYFLNFLDERVEAEEVGLNKHGYKKLKTEIKGLLVQR